MARGGFPGGMNMGNMMKQAQKMQQDMLRVQAELEEAEYTASAGGGVVEATVTGKNRVVGIKIQPEAVDPDDVEMLEDLIVAAIGEAMNQAESDAAEKMKKVTGGMNLPGMF
ncbi:MAG: YbaB/EbfC family nucleoid-associated protein [Oscillospiraceae bacterium]|nr:YbaB/EbfC family nucleoid-associated protein [Oscillospiraceae bacterium]